MKSSFFYLGFVAWVPLAAVLYGGYLTYGLPHFLWAYEWREFVAAAQTNRRNVTCTHLGPYGGFKVPAVAGQCAWVVFRKAENGNAPS